MTKLNGNEIEVHMHVLQQFQGGKSGGEIVLEYQ